MVKSVLNDSITFHDTKVIDQEDLNYDATQYEMILGGYNVIIAIGKEKYTFINNNIIYFPIYLVKQNKIESQIGVYEIFADNYTNLIDTDGDITIFNNKQLHLYSFVTRNLLDDAQVSDNIISNSTVEESIGQKNENDIGEEDEDEDEDEDDDEGDDEGNDEGDDGPSASVLHDQRNILLENEPPLNDVHKHADWLRALREVDAHIDAEAAAANVSISVDMDGHGRRFAVLSPAGDDEGDDDGDDEDEDEDEDDEEESEDEDNSLVKNTSAIDINQTIKSNQDNNDQQDNNDKQDNNDQQDIYNWMKRYMKNDDYNIIENEGGGDCLFAAIRDGFNTKGITKSVKELRDILANNATPNIFLNYKEQYDLIYNSIQTDIANLEKLKQENIKLETNLTQSIDRNTEQDIRDKLAKNNAEYSKITQEKKTSQSMLTEYAYMKNITTFEQYKQYIKTDFWGDTWAISTLERELNIKLILFSYEQYAANNINNVLTCGQLNDSNLIDSNNFNPSYYILLEYNGYHFRLITFKNQGLFIFNEIPETIKQLVVTRCMQGADESGPYDIIPDFQKLKHHQIGGKLCKHKITRKLKQRNPHKNTRRIRCVDLGETISDSMLYNNEVIFVIGIKSNNKPLPGKGSREKIIDSHVRQYAELSKYKKWREKLDNLWPAQIKLDGYVWKSVEHYIQACKFRRYSHDFYLQFSLESGSELSKDPLLARAAGSITGKHKKKIIRKKSISIDKNYNKAQYKIDMKKALYAKYTQHIDLKNILIATKNAKLIKYVNKYSRSKISCIELMRLRYKLTSKI